MYPKYCKIKNVVLSQCDTDVNNLSGAGIQSFHCSIIESGPVAHGFVRQRGAQIISAVFECSRSLGRALEHHSPRHCQNWAVHQQMETQPHPSRHKAGQACRKIHPWHSLKAERTFKFQIFQPISNSLTCCRVSSCPSNEQFLCSLRLFIAPSPFQWDNYFTNLH